MLLLLALTACQSSARKDPVGILKRVDEDIRKTEVARESDDRYLESQVERATRPIRVVRIPRSAQWLRDEVIRPENPRHLLDSLNIVVHTPLVALDHCWYVAALGYKTSRYS
jgi:hypothetical protein